MFVFHYVIIQSYIIKLVAYNFACWVLQTNLLKTINYVTYQLINVESTNYIHFIYVNG